MVITKKELDYIAKHKNHARFSVKVDFGLREIAVNIDKDKILFENGLILNLKDKLKENFSYFLDDNGTKPIAFFSQDTNKFYKLLPTDNWPTIAIGSVPMHRINSPQRDAQNKISLTKPYGITLDTCMGLGYTAILAARQARRVITFEKDENVVLLAKLNPLSEELFSSKNIEFRKNDICVAIKEFSESYFDCIVHDPPTFKLSPQLYEFSFYSQLYRVLKEGGRLFHYAPLYKIRQGFDFPSKIKGKLKTAGFRIITVSPSAGGILCRK